MTTVVWYDADKRSFVPLFFRQGVEISPEDWYNIKSERKTQKGSTAMELPETLVRKVAYRVTKEEANAASNL